VDWDWDLFSELGARQATEEDDGRLRDVGDVVQLEGSLTDWGCWGRNRPVTVAIEITGINSFSGSVTVARNSEVCELVQLKGRRGFTGDDFGI
jgi:hypothetical protein